MKTLPYHLSEVQTFYDIPVGDETFVKVVGDDGMIWYDWIIYRGEAVIDYSDKGYGQAAIALRDGLIAYFHVDEENRSFLRT